MKDQPFTKLERWPLTFFRKQGIDPQGRMAHSDAKSTKIYTQNHVNGLKFLMAKLRQVKAGFVWEKPTPNSLMYIAQILQKKHCLFIHTNTP
jgi:hypothetical protein